MQRLDRLVYSSGDTELARKATLRTQLASEDLAALAERIAPHGLHLVIEDAVDIAFELEEHHLPPGTVDARGLDALAIAIADPISNDPRWHELREFDRTRATLGSSGLSGPTKAPPLRASRILTDPVEGVVRLMSVRRDPCDTAGMTDLEAQLEALREPRGHEVPPTPAESTPGLALWVIVLSFVLLVAAAAVVLM